MNEKGRANTGFIVHVVETLWSRQNLNMVVVDLNDVAIDPLKETLGKRS